MRMITFEVMPERRRVVVRVEGDVRGPEFLSAMQTLLEADPPRHRDDFVFDLTRYEGTVTHDDLAAFARWLDARFGTIDRGGATTCLVSQDDGFRFWAGAMELEFPQRRFLWVPDMAGAEAALATAPEALSPAAPARSSR